MNSQPTLFEEIPEELHQRVKEALVHVPLSPFQRDPTMKAIREAFRQGKNLRVLAEQLDAFLIEHELYQDVIEPSVLEQIKKEDVHLVCYEILTDSNWVKEALNRSG